MKRITDHLMARGVMAVASAGLGCSLTAEPFNEVAELSPPVGPVNFGSVLDLNQNPGVQPQLRGGSIARSADWPASLFATFRTDRGTKVCTAALVGPQAMLTAAHCVPASGIVTFKFAGTDFTTDCEQHPSYKDRRDVSADFALCRVRVSDSHPKGVSLGPGNRFERIDTDSMENWIAAQSAAPIYVTLGGFGCISDIVAENAIDEKYRVGRTYFVESSRSPSRERGDGLYAPLQVNNLITVDDSAYANLCPGDSGGPAFAFAEGKRVIIGVNSRVFYRDQTRTSYGASLISATGGPSFVSWAEQWAKRSPKVQVCGVEGSSRGCR